MGWKYLKTKYCGTIEAQELVRNVKDTAGNLAQSRLPEKPKSNSFPDFILRDFFRDLLEGFSQRGGQEGHAGEYHMLKEGALDGIQGIFGLHVAPEMPTGTICSRPGPILAGSGRFVVTVQGKGGHAAAPHLTADPILAACSVILSLQQLVSRETDPLEPRVVTVGFVKGGQADNVTAESVLLKGTFRSMTLEGLHYLQQRIKEVIEMQASVHKCTATTDFMLEKMRPYPPLVIDEALYEHGKSVSEALVGETNVYLLPMSMGAEDFSFYTHQMAAALFMIGTKNDTLGSNTTDLHSPLLVIDEEVLPIGAALHAAVAISLLDNTTDAAITRSLTS